MRTKYSYRTASREEYKKFCAAFPDIQIEYKKWKEVIYTFSYLFRDYLLQTGDMGKLPWGFGYFSVQRKKIKRYKNFKDQNGNNYVNLPVDWKASKELKKKIYHFNFHTDGYSYVWMWHRNTAKLGYIDVMYFQPSRKTKRELAKYLNKPGYPQIYREYLRPKYKRV